MNLSLAASILVLVVSTTTMTVTAKDVSCPTENIIIGGSSDVHPLAQSWIDGYKEECVHTNIVLEEATSTTAGIRRVCDQSSEGETPLDVATLSRPWTDEEGSSVNGVLYDCAGSDRQVINVPIATYGLSIAVGTGGVAHDCISILGGLTMDQLRWIYSDFTREQLIDSGWDPSSLKNDDMNDKTHKWSELHEKCADEEILISGAAQNTPTYDFFYHEVFKSPVEDIPVDDPRETGVASFLEYVSHQHASSLADYLASNGAAISFFDYEAEMDYEDKLITVPIQNKYGLWVTPDASNISSGDYMPFSRKLHLVLLNNERIIDAMKGFVLYGYSKDGMNKVDSVGYFPIMPWEQVAALTALGLTDIDLEAFECGTESGFFEIAGSLSTYPVTQVWAETYMQKCNHVDIRYTSGGSTRGAKRVCDESDKFSSVDVGAMSRAWKSTEAETNNGYAYECFASDREVIQVEVAIQAVIVAVKRDGVASNCMEALGGLSKDQLRWIYSSWNESQLKDDDWNSSAIRNSDGDPTTHLWSELLDHPDCPATEIKISGADNDSVNTDFFEEMILPGYSSGEYFALDRPDGFYQSKAEADLLQYLVENGDAISFVSYSYFRSHDDDVWAVKIQNNRGDYIDPMDVSIQDGTYNPLAQRLYMNVYKEDYSLGHTRPFFEMAFSDLGAQLVGYTGFTPILSMEWLAMKTRLQTETGIKMSKLEQTQCGPEDRTIWIAGSSTVFPISKVWGDIYEITCDVIVDVEGGGSSLGADRICGGGYGPVDIGMMSREWRDTEARQERTLGGSYQCLDFDTSRSAIQVPVAIDGLTVAAASSGTARECIDLLGGLTMSQLRWIFSSYSTAELEATGWDPAALPNSDGDDSTHLWSELNSACSPKEIMISGADDLSGTFYYFLESVLTDHSYGETFDLERTFGYYSGADDDLVTYLNENDAAIGYFGFSYYFYNDDGLYTVGVQNSDGQYIAPNPDTVSNGSYDKLSRRVYMNLSNNPQSLESTVPFIVFGMSDVGRDLVETTGYVPLPLTVRDEVLNMLSSITGSEIAPVYNGGIDGDSSSVIDSNDNSWSSSTSNSSNDNNGSDGGLGGGAIAGIVIVCALAFGILNVFIWRKVSTRKQADTMKNNRNPYQDRVNWAQQEPEDVPIPTTARVV